MIQIPISRATEGRERSGKERKRPGKVEEGVHCRRSESHCSGSSGEEMHEPWPV